MKKFFTPHEKFLIRRYLIWCYKTTKEEFDRIERYFTQNVVDNFLLENLMESKKFSSPEYKTLVKDFENYKDVKINNAQKKKFSDQSQRDLLPQYQYVKNRFKAIEKAVVHFLGKSELLKIEKMYEEEMTRRILEAREHT